MTRRDLIVAAILLNIGALSFILLFSSNKTKGVRDAPSFEMSVMEPRRQQEFSEFQPKAIEETHSTASKPMEPHAFDEIDQLLEEYVTSEAKEPIPPPKPVAELHSRPPLMVAKEEPLKKEKEGDESSMYIIKSGDNPWKIARKFHISFEKLLELNNLDEAKAKNLKIGQRIKIRE